MAYRTAFCAIAVGVAGVFALTSGTLAAPKKQQGKYPADSYEAWGSPPGQPPVPGFAMSTYKPGMCWKVAPGAQTYQIGGWVPCSQWRKHSE